MKWCKWWKNDVQVPYVLDINPYGFSCTFLGSVVIHRVYTSMHNVYLITHDLRIWSNVVLLIYVYMMYMCTWCICIIHVYVYMYRNPINLVAMIQGTWSIMCWCITIKHQDFGRSWNQQSDRRLVPSVQLMTAPILVNIPKFEIKKHLRLRETPSLSPDPFIFQGRI